MKRVSKNWLLGMIAAALLLSGCQKQESTVNGETGEDTVTTAAPVEVEFSKPREELFSDRDYESEYDESSCVRIELSDDGITASSAAVGIKDKQVTLTEEATYLISGSLSGGQLVVNAKETAKLRLVLDGVSVQNDTTAPLYIVSADKVFVTLAEGSENSLSAGETFEAIDENAIDGAIFSKQDLTVNGSGSLTVTSPGGHGIVVKDDLVMTGGSITVTSASHGLDVNDSLRVDGATVTVDAGKDGIHAEHSDNAELGYVYVCDGCFDIESEGDGISAGAYIQLEKGTYRLLCGGGSVNGTKETSDSYGGFMGGGMRPGKPTSSTTASSTTTESGTSIKGIKATTGILINGGSFTVDSADDAIHSNSDLVVNGGDFTVATGDDAFHADETLTVTGGTVSVSACYEGLEALNLTVSGGELSMVCTDDGLNAAGGTDSSGFGGTRGGDRFGGGMMGGMSASSNGSILISGGRLYIESSGDGIDANGTLTITGGYTVVCGPTQGDTATLDYDVSATISGGTFIGTGASGMAQTFSDAEQGVLALSVGTQSAKTEITVKNEAGELLLTHTPDLSYGVFIYSSAALVKGETYTVSVGEYTGEFEAQ